MINIFIIVVAVGGGDGYGGINITITGGINIHKNHIFTIPPVLQRNL